MTKPILRDAPKRNRRALIIVAAGAFCLGAAFLAAVLLLSSCSASVSSTIQADGGARISVAAEMPPVLAAKFRKLAQAGDSPAKPEPFFDAAAIRKSINARPGLAVSRLSQPSGDSISVEISARSIEELAASPDLDGSGAIEIRRGPTWTEFRLRIERGDAKAFSALLPGIDPYLMEALSPPALEEDPVSLDEYKTMLKSVLGAKNMPAIEAAALNLRFTAPGPILASGGGTLSGSTLSARIPIIEALALEKPIELWLRWKNPE